MELSVLAIIAAVAAAPAVAWVVGDQSEAGGSIEDRVLQPFRIPDRTWWLVGIGSLVVVVLALLRVFRAVWSKSCPEAWLVSVGAFAAVGAYVGLGYRIATARVTGANIGYGIFVLFGGPVVVGTLLVGIGAMVRGWQLQLRPPFTDSATG